MSLGYRDGGGGVYGESRISAAAMVRCWGGSLDLDRSAQNAKPKIPKK